MWWIILLTPLIILMMLTLYFLAFLQWHATAIRGDKYFSLPSDQRMQFAKSLKKHTYLLIPFTQLVSHIFDLNRLPYFRYKGISCPRIISNKSIFQKAESYPATKDDIFVATQMKCGTTWMQQIVFEILHHGEGDLSDTGYRHMYALSPWIETSPNASVPMERAPLVSRYKKRIIKTHLPVSLCPFSHEAKYIYVTRNPVNCFASCQDFLRMLSGPFCPKTHTLKKWFCSNDMWWGSWPDHVAGWWDLSNTNDNIFFITFEQLKDDPKGCIEEISKFLAINLTPQDLERVVYKTSFAYMSDNEDQFQMSAPNIFSVSADNLRFMQSGNKHRHESVNNECRQDIINYCSNQLRKRQFPFDEIYNPSMDKLNTPTMNT